MEPNYPLLAKQMKVQGAVVLAGSDRQDRHIQDLHVVSGPTILAAAAREAVKQWHFKPYYQSGQASGNRGSHHRELHDFDLLIEIHPIRMKEAGRPLSRLSDRVRQQPKGLSECQR